MLDLHLYEYRKLVERFKTLMLLKRQQIQFPVQ